MSSKKLQCRLAITAVSTLLPAFSPTIAATPPALINYQGVLRDANDAPLTGPYDMVFRFMDAPAGGGEIMLDQYIGESAVKVSGGLFNVSLGSGTVSDGSSSGTYTSLDAVFRDFSSVWLEQKVGTETLSPRTRIKSAAYALNATNAVAAVNATNATTATNSTQLNGQAGSFYVDTSSTTQLKSGALRLESTNYTPASTLEAVAYGTSPLAFYAQNDDGSSCRLAQGQHALECSANAFQTWAGYFGNTSSLANVMLADGAYGVIAGASYAPGDFQNFSGNVVLVGLQTYKIQGNGSVSFVQNHPTDPSKVIVYAAPEGDEVAVYTRGSARLIDGEARVTLGETFALVANPDIGLTAQVTARGELPVPLAAAAVSTHELVVHGPAGSDAWFDYVVWGLRIGFEAQSIVQPKAFEAKIPSMIDHEAYFAADPSLRRYTALDRFKQISARMRGPARPDLSRADTLREAIGVYEPNSTIARVSIRHRPEEVATDRERVSPSHAAAPSRAINAAPEALPPGSTSVIAAVPCDTRAAVPGDPIVMLGSGTFDTGDVVSLDAASPGSVQRSSSAGDRLVIGCVVAPDEMIIPAGQVAIATNQIALCKVDAAFGAVSIGDRLVASSNPGHAMRADVALVDATVLGRAIDPLPIGTGLIRVLVTIR